jgi:tetratricopeptide (TPR) repeat protein
MRATFPVALVASCTISALVCVYGNSQRSANTLTEEDLIKLIKTGASPNALITLVQKYGISFQPDEATLARLKKEGAPDILLDAIRPAPPPPQPKPPEPAPRPETHQQTARMLEAEQHLKLSQLKAQDKDFEGALAELVEAEKIRPQWEDVFYQRGLVFAQLHRYTEAANEWKKYLTLAGAQADAKTVQDKIVEWEYQAQKDQKLRQLEDQGEQDLKDFNAEGAIAAFQEVAKTQPSLPNLLFLAEAFWMKRDYESLAKLATQALALDPNSARATLYRGAAELGQKRIENGLATIQRALTFDPNSAFAYELYCDAFRLKGDLKNAWDQCQHALQINPNSGLAHNRLGWMLLNRRNHSAGLAELRKAIEAEPKNVYWHSDLAYALLPLGDVHAALEAAREALRLDVKCPDAHDAMGLVLEAQGNVEQAILEFNEAIRLAPLGRPEYLKHLNQAMRKSKSAPPN